MRSKNAAAKLRGGYAVVVNSPRKLIGIVIPWDQATYSGKKAESQYREFILEETKRR